MATFTALFRTNYFTVKDEDAFLTWVATIPGLETLRNNPCEQVSAFALIAHSGEPTLDIDDEEINIVEELAQHINPGQVAITMEIGNEGMRYLTGTAKAVDATGRVVQLSLWDIFEEAHETFGIEASQGFY